MRKNQKKTKAPFTHSEKNFLHRAFFVSLMYAGNFLLSAGKFLRSKLILKTKINVRRTKLFTPLENRALCE